MITSDDIEEAYHDVLQGGVQDSEAVVVRLHCRDVAPRSTRPCQSRRQRRQFS